MAVYIQPLHLPFPAYRHYQSQVPVSHQYRIIFKSDGTVIYSGKEADALPIAI